MKLCIILPPGYFPYPLNSGGSQAVFNMIDNLRYETEISLVFAYKNRERMYIEQLRKIWGNVKFFGFEKSLVDYKKYPMKIFDGIVNKLFKKSALKIDTIDYAYLDFFCDILEKNKFDIIQTEFFPAMNYIYAIKQQAKTIFVQHEIRYIRDERLIKTSLNYYYYFLMKKNKQEEITAMNMYDVVVTLSDIDKKILQNDGVKVPIYDSPAMVKETAKYNENYTFQNKIVFLAGGKHPPNSQGLEWFLENIWINLKGQCPQIKFHIVGGSWDKAFFSKYRDIDFLGFVPNLESVLQNAIMVIPLLAGSGMRIKILDGINFGCPIVTTSIGVEGLAFENEKDLIIEDDPQQFMKKLCDLINNEERQKRLRINAKTTKDKLYSKEILIEKRLNVYRSVL